MNNDKGKPAKYTKPTAAQMKQLAKLAAPEKPPDVPEGWTARAFGLLDRKWHNILPSKTFIGCPHSPYVSRGEYRLVGRLVCSLLPEMTLADWYASDEETQIAEMDAALALRDRAAVVRKRGRRRELTDEDKLDIVDEFESGLENDAWKTPAEFLKKRYAARWKQNKRSTSSWFSQLQAQVRLIRERLN